ncbi:MAG TPA: hypothetical protein VGS20_14905 [Candidatus Acidoferrales bacterium]|nr:hypothetical protein [Candidatus Acidoferrales bacterium]
MGDTSRDPKAHSAGPDWPPAAGLLVLIASTTVIDSLMLLTGRVALTAMSLPGVVFLQAYFIWYYFARFLPARRMFAAECPAARGGFVGLFLMATFGTSLVALVASYAIRHLPHVRK